jgi:transposase-like protein
MRKHYTGEQRSALVELVTAERATIADAAARLGVNVSTAYNWMQRPAASEPRRSDVGRRVSSRKRRQVVRPTFVQLVRANDLAATIAVRVGSAEVQVRRGFDADLLRAVVEALRGAA